MSYKGVSDEMLEMENDHLEEEMASRVSLMKSLAKDLRNESVEQTDWLSDKRDAVSRAGVLMGTSWSRVKEATQKGSKDRKLMCYFALAAVFFFFLLFYLVKRLMFSASVK